MQTIFISLQIASHQLVLWFAWSICLESSTYLGISTPNLWVLIQYLDFIFAMIWFFFLITKWIYQSKTGRLLMTFWIEYSANWTGYNYFMSLRGLQVVIPYFHWSNIPHLFVVWRLQQPPFFEVIYASLIGSSVPLVQWSAMQYNRTCRLPSSSTWENIFSAMALAVKMPCGRRDIRPHRFCYPTLDYHELLWLVARLHIWVF